jgi:two-component system response regulator
MTSSSKAIAACARADERTKSLPVVVFTSSKEPRDPIDDNKLGVNAYAQKPVDFEQFSETVRQVGMFWMLVNQAPTTGCLGASKTQSASK